MFLPAIRAFLCLLALLSWGVLRAQDTGPAPRVQVVAGTGGIDPDWVDRVRRTVQAELPALVRVFDGVPKHPFFVHVHRDREGMPESLVAHLHEDSPAFAMLGQHQIHLIRGEIERTGARLDIVVRHELVHELLDQYVAPNGRVLPRWFHEGLAQFLAGGTYLQASEDDLVWRIATKRLPGFTALAQEFPRDTLQLRLAYAQSYSYVAWLVAEEGLADVLAVARNADDFTSFERALVGRFQRSTLDLEEGWRHYVLHGSGAPWRVALDQCFSLSLIALLPVVVLAVIRRLHRERRIGRQMVAREAVAAAAAAAAAAASAAAAAAEAIVPESSPSATAPTEGPSAG